MTSQGSLEPGDISGPDLPEPDYEYLEHGEGLDSYAGARAPLAALQGPLSGE